MDEAQEWLNTIIQYYQDNQLISQQNQLIEERLCQLQSLIGNYPKLGHIPAGNVGLGIINQAIDDQASHHEKVQLKFNEIAQLINDPAVAKAMQNNKSTCGGVL